MIYTYFLLFSKLVFHFLDNVLWCTNILILMKSNLCIFSLVAHALGIISINLMPNPRSRKLILIYYGFDIIFKSLVHFELHFYGVRQGSNFIFLYVKIQLSLHHLLKRLFFLNWVFLKPLLQIHCPDTWRLVYRLSILFHCYFFILYFIHFEWIISLLKLLIAWINHLHE